MIKPTFPKLRRFSPDEIREVRRVFRMSRAQFARFFPVSGETIKGWETGRRNPYGPSSTILAQLKTYTDHVTAEKRAALDRLLNKK